MAVEVATITALPIVMADSVQVDNLITVGVVVAAAEEEAVVIVGTMIADRIDGEAVEGEEEEVGEAAAATG